MPGSSNKYIIPRTAKSPRMPRVMRLLLDKHPKLEKEKDDQVEDIGTAESQ